MPQLMTVDEKISLGDDVLAGILKVGDKAGYYIDRLSTDDLHPSRQLLLCGLQQLQAQKLPININNIMELSAESEQFILREIEGGLTFAMSNTDTLDDDFRKLKGDPEKIEAEKVWATEQPKRDPYPEAALTGPGVIGEICDYFNATAIKDQPLFAVPVALTCISAAIGRNYMLEIERGSFSSLWNIILAPAGAGKEHPQTIINSILAQSDLSHIIGPSTPNSDSALVSMLSDQPRVCVVADEYQGILQDAAQNNSYAYSALSEMRKVWGKCSGVLIPKGLSHRGASKDKKIINKSTIDRPAMTFFAAAQTGRVKQVMNRKLIHDGTMSRFQVIVSDEESQHVIFKIGAEKSQYDIPGPVKTWFKFWGNTHNGQLGIPDDDPQNPPDFTRVPFLCQESADLLTEFSAKVDKDQRSLSADYKIGELGSRRVEICCRIILCATMANTKPSEQPKVTKEITEWAIEYVNFHWEREMNFYIESVGGTTEHGEQREIILDAIKADTENFGGMKVRKLIRGTGAAREVRNIPKRIRENIIEDFISGGLVREQHVIGKTGQRMKAYVALNPED